MTDKLTLNISATQTKDYNIKLRKFFCMIFFDKSGKKLDVFLATIFGGYGKEKNNEYPSYKPNKSAELTFQLSSRGNTSNLSIKNIKFNDLSTSFLDQANQFQSFWGEAKRLESQTKAEEEIMKLYFSNDPEHQINIIQVSSNSGSTPVYFIDNTKNENERCIVTKAVFKETDKNSFSLMSNEKAYCDGLEYINWVNCEVSLNRSVLKNRFEFDIILGSIEKTPDFTCYFAPPVNYSVDSDTAVLSYNGKDSNGREIKSESEKNKISRVSDDTTVDFKEWKDLQIFQRTKSRAILEKNCNYSDIGIIISIIEDDEARVIRQFFFSLIFAFLLSYFTDQTRVNDFRDCFDYSKIIQIGKPLITLCLAIMVGSSIMNWLCIQKNIRDAEDKSKKGTHWKIKLSGGVIPSTIAISIFIILPFYSNLVNQIGKIASIIISAVFISTMVLSIILNIINIHNTGLRKGTLKEILK